MADWDNKNNDIRSRLPEWWKNDLFLEPINRYSQELAIQIIGTLLTNIGVVQPFQVWKYLPKEYDWSHHYSDFDDYAYCKIYTDPSDDDELSRIEKLLKQKITTQDNIPLTVNPPIDDKVNKKELYLKVPNTKRNCHAKIDIQLLGDINNGLKPIKEFKIKNASQEIVIKNIDTHSHIQILTKEQSILIDGVDRSSLTEGMFYKIKPEALNSDTDKLDVYDENKITQISFECDEDISVKLNADIKLYEPVYVTEQHIRLSTISSFPLEWVKLYGFFCNDFNEKEEWQFLWEKHYDLKDRTVYDRITKQFDCERFYIQIKVHGLGLPINIGFPQEEYPTDPTFAINNKLDYWGRIYGMPRRYYRTDISEDEEPFTYPPYYSYEIEQDYWYEERMVNEYRETIEPQNTLYLKDTDTNNLAILETIDPFMNDICVYTETILPTIDNNHETEDIIPFHASQKGDGQTWSDALALKEINLADCSVKLEPKTDKSYNNKDYMAKVLELKFKTPDLPKNIIVKGLKLKFNGLTDIHSDTLALDKRTILKLPFKYEKDNGDVFEKEEVFKINHYDEQWQKGNGYYTIGGEDDLLGLEEIERYQIEDEVKFEIGFTNNNDFLVSNISLYNIKLKIYYETLEDTYDTNIQLNRREIVLNDSDKQDIKMLINLKNTGEIPIVDKNIFIAVSPELNISNDTFYFGLDVNEEFTIGESNDEIIITSNGTTGLFDIIVFCYDKVVKNEILVRQGKEE